MNFNFIFTIAERLTLMALLPEQGNYLTLNIVKEFKERIGFTEDDIKKFNIVDGPGVFVDSKGNKIKVPEGNMMWDMGKDKGIQYEIGPKLFDIIYKALDDAEKHDRLKATHMSVYEKIVLPIKEAEEKEKSLPKAKIPTNKKKK